MNTLSSRRISGTSIDVHPLCLGGNVFGWSVDAAGSFDVLDAYVEAGGNFIDTADQYAFWKPGNSGGESERILGDWMRARGKRDDLVIATKVGRLPGREGLADANIRLALAESLKRLGTDYIDIYYAHADDEHTPLADTLGTFASLEVAGSVRHVAASNYSGTRLAAALATQGARYVALQTRYNLLDREPYESELRPVAVATGTSVFPYYSLASGYLTGKYRTTAFSGVRAEAASGYDTAEGRASVDRLVAVADARGVEPAAIAIAWLLSHTEVTSAIASATCPSQLEALLVGSTIVLSAEEILALDGP
ncbi:aldo/keto reductase [soil metagenome]